MIAVDCRCNCARQSITLRLMARDAIELEIFKSIFHSIAEEMGAALRRTAFSPNIKERRDYSCAVFDREGQVIAMGDHMPVHLGSMPMSVAAAIEWRSHARWRRGHAQRSFRGGTHLPDITLVAPVFVNRAKPGPAARGIPTSTWPRARTMPMWAALTPAPWDSAARYTRRAFASLR